MTVLLDAGSKGPSTVITGGLHASCTTNVENGARADLKHDALTYSAPQNRYWFEMTNNFVSLAGDSGNGLTPAASPNYANLAANAAGGLIVFRSGQVYLNGFITAFQVTGGTRFDSVMFAVNFDLNLCWARTPGSGGWWGQPIGVADPDAGIGGLDISAITATGLYPVGLITSLANSFDAYFSSGSVNTPPSTYGSWDGIPPGVVGLRASHIARMSGFRNRATAVAVGGVLPDVFGNPGIVGYGFEGDITLLATDQRDVLTAVCEPTVGFDLLVTDQRDTFSTVVPSSYNIGGLNTPTALADDDVIYVLENNETIYVPGDFSSSFVIHSDDTMYAT